MGRSSSSSNKPLVVFTGTYPEYSVKGYSKAVLANILNIGSELMKTPFHQKWIHRRLILKQTTLNCAAQK